MVLCLKILEIPLSKDALKRSFFFLFNFKKYVHANSTHKHTLVQTDIDRQTDGRTTFSSGERVVHNLYYTHI